MASNVELLIHAFAGWGKDNPANIAELMDEDSELVVPDSIPYGGVYRGPEAIANWFARDLWRWFDEFTSTPTGVIDAGDQIVVRVRVQATAKNGRALDAENVWVTSSRTASLAAGASMRIPPSSTRRLRAFSPTRSSRLLGRIMSCAGGRRVGSIWLW